MTKMKRWTVGLVFCFLLGAFFEASAAYIVVENISQDAPDWGDCSCHDATGWLTAMFMGFTVVDGDGTTYVLVMVPADYYPRNVTASEDFYLLGITKEDPVAPGGSYTSKKIVALPDSGFTFKPAGANIGVHYCEAALDSCGGYSTGTTNVVNELFIMPGVSGSDSFEFQVPAAGSINGPAVVRVTFYPGNPPPRGKNK